MHQRIVKLALAISLLLITVSVWADHRREGSDRQSSDVASVWFDTLYDVVKSEGTPPPATSRIYGVTAVALYEAVVPGTRHYRSLVGQLNDLDSIPKPKKDKAHHWPTAANAALARTIRGLFPTLKPASLAAIDALEQRFAAQFQVEVKRKEFERSVAQGQAVADTILAWAAADGFATFHNCPYLPRPVPGLGRYMPSAVTSIA